MERQNDTEREGGSGIKKIQGSDAEAEKGDVGSSDRRVSDGNSDNPHHKQPDISGRGSGPARRSSRGNWTEEEDKILEAAVQRYNGKCWKRIAMCLPDRTDVQCLHRWQKVLNPMLVKGPWTKEEDDALIELVGKQGNKKWSEIAKHLPGRIGKQCRERWHNHLNPEIKRSAWTKAEELILMQAHSLYGNRWAEIAKLLQGRSENSIKNHWNCYLKKKLELCPSYGSALGHHQLVNPFPHGTKTESGNRKEVVVKESKGMGFSLNQKMNCGNFSDSCSLDLVLECSPGEESHLQASKNENCGFHGWQAIIPLEPPSPRCTLIKEGLDGGDYSNRSANRCNNIPHQSKVSSGPFLTEQFIVHSSSPNRSCKDGYLFNTSSRSLPCKYQLPFMNSSLDASDGGKSFHLTYTNACLVNSEEKYKTPERQLGGPFSWENSGSNDSHSSQSHKSFLIMPKDGVNEKKDKTSGMFESSLDESYTGLCYEPLQEKDVMVFLSTDRFASTDSFIRLPSTGDTQNSRKVEKNLSAYSFSASRLKNAATSFKNIPSIIRKRRHETSIQASNIVRRINNFASVEVANSSNDRLQAKHEFPCEGREDQLPKRQKVLASPQKAQKLDYSSSINATFNNVWDLSSRSTNSKEAADSFDSDDESDTQLTPDSS